MPHSNPPPLMDRFRQGDIRALGRLLTMVENRGPETGRILEVLFPLAGDTFRIGITGAPGAGKSTLVNHLARMMAGEGEGVAVLAVDPTSPFTGGALLGDRIRFDPPGEAGGQVFFRSAASRGHTGGLARTTEEMSVVLEAFGFQRLLIESVGVGQVGLDIAQACDVTVVVVVPESGDDIQALKAGLLEVADILVVNKADRPGAETLQTQLREAVDYRGQEVHGGRPPPILMTQGTSGEGVLALQQEIDRFHHEALPKGQAEARRRDRIRQSLLNLMREEFRSAIGRAFRDGRLPGGEPLEQALEDIAQGRANPFQLAQRNISAIMPHGVDPIEE